MKKKILTVSTMPGSQHGSPRVLEPDYILAHSKPSLNDLNLSIAK